MAWEKKNLHLIRFELLANELQNPKCGRSASGADSPILIPNIYDVCATDAYICDCRQVVVDLW